jgi:hypothetical protein
MFGELGGGTGETLFEYWILVVEMWNAINMLMHIVQAGVTGISEALVPKK